MIKEYFSAIEYAIQEFPDVRSVSIRKKIFNIKQGVISGSIIFENGYRLDFVEVKNADIKSKVKYRYQYMDAANNLIFRYDNAPHHSGVETFPHHKHDRNKIRSANEPTLLDILLEVVQVQRKLSLKKNSVEEQNVIRKCAKRLVNADALN